MRDVTIMGLLFFGDDNLQSGFDSAKEKRKYGLRRPGMQLEEEGRIGVAICNNYNEEIQTKILASVLLLSQLCLLCQMPAFLLTCLLVWNQLLRYHMHA
jgi:hypothetical protein